METTASGFDCQGLEIDFPIVIFGGDYVVRDGKFDFDESNLGYHLKKYKNPKLIMENIYRVLLTRSRKGMILYVPDDKNLDDTYDFIRSVGVNN